MCLFSMSFAVAGERRAWDMAATAVGTYTIICSKRQAVWNKVDNLKHKSINKVLSFVCLRIVLRVVFLFSSLFFLFLLLFVSCLLLPCLFTLTCVVLCCVHSSPNAYLTWLYAIRSYSMDSHCCSSQVEEGRQQHWYFYNDHIWLVL